MTTQDDVKKETRRMLIEEEVIKMAKSNEYPFFLVSDGSSEKFWKLVKSIND